LAGGESEAPTERAATVRGPNRINRQDAKDAKNRKRRDEKSGKAERFWSGSSGIAFLLAFLAPWRFNSLVLLRKRFDERKPGSAFAPIGKGRKWACESATLAVPAARES
jgi:hypothetical protein